MHHSKILLHLILGVIFTSHPLCANDDPLSSEDHELHTINASLLPSDPEALREPRPEMATRTTCCTHRLDACQMSMLEDPRNPRMLAMTMGIAFAMPVGFGLVFQHSNWILFSVPPVVGVVVTGVTYALNIWVRNRGIQPIP